MGGGGGGGCDGGDPPPLSKTLMTQVAQQLIIAKYMVSKVFRKNLLKNTVSLTYYVNSECQLCDDVVDMADKCGVW